MERGTEESEVFCKEMVTQLNYLFKLDQERYEE